MKTKKKLINILLWANSKKDNQLRINKEYVSNLEQFNKDKEARIEILHKAKCKAENEVASLESQNKALQANSSEFEKGMIALSESNERLREENKQLQSVVDSLNSLKTEIDGAESCTVWIAMDAPINSDERYIYIYNQLPILRQHDGNFETPNTQYGDISELDLPIELQPQQCKQFQLVEVKCNPQYKKLQFGNLRVGDVFYYGEAKEKRTKVSKTDYVVDGSKKGHEMRIDMFVYVEVKP